MIHMSHIYNHKEGGLDPDRSNLDKESRMARIQTPNHILTFGCAPNDQHHQTSTISCDVRLSCRALLCEPLDGCEVTNSNPSKKQCTLVNFSSACSTSKPNQKHHHHHYHHQHPSSPPPPPSPYPYYYHHKLDHSDWSSLKTTSSTLSYILSAPRRSSKQQTTLLFTILFTLSPFIILASANRIVIKPADRVVLTPGHELSLRCDVADYPQTGFRWYRTKQVAKNIEPPADPLQEELLPDDDRYVIHNNNIIIRSPTLNDVGDYYCRVWPADVRGIEKEKMVRVRVRPFIEDFRLSTSTGRSAVLMEGERLVLNCNVMDEYSPNVDIQWFKSKFPDDETEMEEITSDGRLRLETVNATSRSLTIDSITKDDRSYYKCQAANGVTDNSKVIMIRVRDKLIALWPTIGIIVELVILFGVIFVTENRKVEPDFDTSGRKIIQM